LGDVDALVVVECQLLALGRECRCDGGENMQPVLVKRRWFLPSAPIR
jgi:hypothetical protein